jgi:Flp pilus assembly protein TadB
MNSSAIILIFVVILAVAGISFQYLKGIGKSFQNNESSSSINTRSLQQQQKQQAQDAEEQRRAYMENVKQRMRDNQR